MAMDVRQDDLQLGLEPLSRYLVRPEAPDPMERKIIDEVLPLGVKVVDGVISIGANFISCTGSSTGGVGGVGGVGFSFSHPAHNKAIATKTDKYPIYLFIFISLKITTNPHSGQHYGEQLSQTPSLSPFHPC